VILYSSTDNASTSTEKGDPNAYLPFKVIDAAIIDCITSELDQLGERDAQGGIKITIRARTTVHRNRTLQSPSHLSAL
jgi:hypothetical protein